MGICSEGFQEGGVMKKKLAFFLGISPNFAFAAGNVAIALNRYCKGTEYDIVIYHSGVSNRDLEAFSRIPHCILRGFSLDDDFVEFMICSLPEDCRFRTREKLMCFAHFEAFALLREYENVIWLDADVLVQDDLLGLVQFGPLAFTPDGHSVGEQFFSPPQCKYDLEREAFRIDMMVLGDSLPYERIYQWCYDEARSFASYSKNPEQAIINLCLQEFHLKPAVISEKWQCFSYRPETVSARCVHFGTDRKVWNDKVLYVLYPEWYRNHMRWVELGGGVSEDYQMEGASPWDVQRMLLREQRRFFLFHKIPENSKLIIYGGGGRGHRYVEQIQRIAYYKIVAVLDKDPSNVEEFTFSVLGAASFHVLYPEEIAEAGDYDYVVIALKAEEMIREAEDILLRSGVPKEKIVWNEG